MPEHNQPKRRIWSRRKRWLFACTALFLSVAFSCAVAEFALRRFHVLDEALLIGKDGKQIYLPDPDLVYAMRPNAESLLQKLEFSVSFKTNSFGYRDEEFTMPPDPAQFVIAGLGDSFGCGHGVNVEDSFFEVAERLLRKSSPGVRIDNLSAHGYSQKQQVHQIDLAKRLGAKMVVIAACASNDVLENDDIIERRLGEDGQRNDRSEDRSIGRNAADEKKESWLYKNSHLVRFILTRMQNIGPNLELGSGTWYVLDVMRDKHDPRTAHAFEKTKALLDSIVEQCDRANMQLAFVTIPTAWESSEERFQAALAHYKLAAEGMDRHRVTNFYKVYCQSHGLPCLDLIPVLEKKSSHPEEFFFPVDRHMNKKGHRVAGEAIAEFLKPLVNAQENKGDTHAVSP